MKINSKLISTLNSLKNKPRLRVKKFTLFLARIIFLSSILGYLVYKLSIIGWYDVLREMPKLTSFYFLFLLIYFIQPLVEYLIYRFLWGLSFFTCLHVFLRKRVFNFGIIDYLGDVFFFNWARKNLNYSNKQIFSKIKDVNVLSGLSSNLLTIFLICLFFLSDQMNLLVSSSSLTISYIISFLIIGLIILIIFLFLNKYILSLSRKTSLIIFSIHTLRLLFIATLQLLQWSLVLPEVPLSSWFLFLTANFLVTRIPLIPNKDLTLAVLGVSLAGYINADITIITALFLVSGALNQLLNFFIFLLTTFNYKRLNSNL